MNPIHNDFLGKALFIIETTVLRVAGRSVPLFIRPLSAAGKAAQGTDHFLLAIPSSLWHAVRITASRRGDRRS